MVEKLERITFRDKESIFRRVVQDVSLVKVISGAEARGWNPSSIPKINGEYGGAIQLSPALGKIVPDFLVNSGIDPEQYVALIVSEPLGSETNYVLLERVVGEIDITKTTREVKEYLKRFYADFS